MTRPNNPRFPHTCQIIRITDSDNPLKDKGTETVIYEGVCRSYNRDTISDNGDVVASYRTLALPTKQDEWTEDNIPHTGDDVTIHKIGCDEYGEVIDVRPGNLGTHLLWKYVRN